MDIRYCACPCLVLLRSSDRGQEPTYAAFAGRLDVKMVSKEPLESRDLKIACTADDALRCSGSKVRI